MKTLIYNDYHVWDNTQGRILVSDERTKKLYDFKNKDDAVNHMYSEDVALARKINDKF